MKYWNESINTTGGKQYTLKRGVMKDDSDTLTALQSISVSKGGRMVIAMNLTLPIAVWTELFDEILLSTAVLRPDRDLTLKTEVVDDTKPE